MTSVWLATALAGACAFLMMTAGLAWQVVGEARQAADKKRQSQARGWAND